MKGAGQVSATLQPKTFTRLIMMYEDSFVYKLNISDINLMQKDIKNYIGNRVISPYFTPTHSTSQSETSFCWRQKPQS